MSTELIVQNDDAHAATFSYTHITTFGFRKELGGWWGLTVVKNFGFGSARSHNSAFTAANRALALAARHVFFTF